MWKRRARMVFGSFKLKIPTVSFHKNAPKANGLLCFAPGRWWTLWFASGSWTKCRICSRWFRMAGCRHLKCLMMMKIRIKSFHASKNEMDINKGVSGQVISKGASSSPISTGVTDDKQPICARFQVKHSHRDAFSLFCFLSGRGFEVEGQVIYIEQSPRYGNMLSGWGSLAVRGHDWSPPLTHLPSLLIVRRTTYLGTLCML